MRPALITDEEITEQLVEVSYLSYILRHFIFHKDGFGLDSGIFYALVGKLDANFVSFRTRPASRGVYTLLSNIAREQSIANISRPFNSASVSGAEVSSKRGTQFSTLFYLLIIASRFLKPMKIWKARFDSRVLVADYVTA